MVESKISLRRILTGFTMLRGAWAQRKLRQRVRRQGGQVDDTVSILGECKISGRTCIGPGTLIQAAELDGRGGLTIGSHVVLMECTVITAQHNIESPRFETTYLPVSIEDYAVVHQGAIILPGRKVGRGAIVAAGAVVSRDVPAMAVVAGNPAQVVHFRSCVHDACDLYALAGNNIGQRLRAFFQ